MKKFPSLSVAPPEKVVQPIPVHSNLATPNDIVKSFLRGQFHPKSQQQTSTIKKSVQQKTVVQKQGKQLSKPTKESPMKIESSSSSISSKNENNKSGSPKQVGSDSVSERIYKNLDEISKPYPELHEPDSIKLDSPHTSKKRKSEAVIEHDLSIDESASKKENKQQQQQNKKFETSTNDTDNDELVVITRDSASKKILNQIKIKDQNLNQHFHSTKLLKLLFHLIQIQR